MIPEPIPSKPVEIVMISQGQAMNTLNLQPPHEVPPLTWRAFPQPKPKRHKFRGIRRATEEEIQRATEQVAEERAERVRHERRMLKYMGWGIHPDYLTP